MIAGNAGLPRHCTSRSHLTSSLLLDFFISRSQLTVIDVSFSGSDMLGEACN